jgi:hypothetical protein
MRIPAVGRKISAFFFALHFVVLLTILYFNYAVLCKVLGVMPVEKHKI